MWFCLAGSFRSGLAFKEKMTAVDGCGNLAFCARFPSDCGRGLCVHRRVTVHGLFGGAADDGSRRLNGLRVRARTEPPGPRDNLGLRRAEAVLSVVPRFGLYVQLERTAAPTPWTSRSAKKPAGAVTGSSRSVSPVIAATRTARRPVAPSRAAARSPRPVSDIAAARRAASIIAITSARIARA